MHNYLAYFATYIHLASQFQELVPQLPDASRSKATHLLDEMEINPVHPAVSCTWPYLLPFKDMHGFIQHHLCQTSLTHRLTAS